MSKFCASPWMSLFVYNDGMVKSCCAGRGDWGDLKKQTLEEIVNSPKVVKLRQDLLNGVKNSYCELCEECENNSGSSQRDYFQQFNLSNDLISDSKSFDLQMTDIRWNNLCQLNCVYCDPLWSTTWSKLKGIEFQPINNDYHLDVLDAVQKNTDKMQAIILGGGEPLLHKQNVELLQSLSPDIKIDIMTNLSMNLDSSKVFEQLAKKNRVNWCVSFENTGECFEFVRHGAKWDQLNTNLQKIMELKGHEITIKATYNLLSASKLIDLYKFANSIQQQIHWQPLVGPSELNVMYFSKPVLSRLIKEIDDLYESNDYKIYQERHSVFTKEFLDNYRTSMVQRLTEEYESIDVTFKNWILIYNKKYASDVKPFSVLWPEIYELLGE